MVEYNMMKNETEKKKAIVLVGLPANGKSYIRNRLVANMEDFHVYSTDDVIEEFCAADGMTYSQGFNKHMTNASRESEKRLTKAIAEGKNLVWDQTNLGKKKRNRILKRLSKKYEVECYCVLPASNEAQETEIANRLLNRPGKIIPDDIYTRMRRDYEVVSLEEGFKKVNYVDIYGKPLPPSARHFVKK